MHTTVLKIILSISFIVLSLNATRFSRTNDMVKDSQTALQWQDDSEAKTVGKNWSDAIDHCENLSLGGHDDWRLPNINELRSIVNDRGYDPAIYEKFFLNINTAYYWSSTSDTLNNDHAWIIGFSNGRSGSITKDSGYYVRCVR